MNALAIMGIDPGLHGGIAVLDPAGSVLRLMPIPEPRRLLFDILVHWATSVQIAYVELLHGMPHNMRGGIASFKLGKSAGEILMGLDAAGILYDEVEARVWQTRMKCLTGGDKRVSLARAKVLYPAAAELITKDTADALLIARYGRDLIQRAAEQREKRLGK